MDSDLQAVTVDKDLGHGVAQRVHGLDLLRRDVFPLGQFEDVLLPVCDLQSAVLKRDKPVSTFPGATPTHPPPRPDPVVRCWAVELCLLGAIFRCPPCAATRPCPGPQLSSPGPSSSPGTRLVL